MSSRRHACPPERRPGSEASAALAYGVSFSQSTHSTLLNGLSGIWCFGGTRTNWATKSPRVMLSDQFRQLPRLSIHSLGRLRTVSARFPMAASARWTTIGAQTFNLLPPGAQSPCRRSGADIVDILSFEETLFSDIAAPPCSKRRFRALIALDELGYGLCAPGRLVRSFCSERSRNGRRRRR
jgi:hypothetical protein